MALVLLRINRGARRIHRMLLPVLQVEALLSELAAYQSTEPVIPTLAAMPAQAAARM